MNILRSFLNVVLTVLVPYSVRGLPLEEKKLKLKQLVRRFPYWVAGQVQYGELALSSASFEEAYLASQAAQILDPDNIPSKLLRAKVFLRYARFDEAEKVLEELRLKAPTSIQLEVLEYLAAAYMGLEKEAKAKEILQKIPEKKLSPASAVLLNHLMRKV